MADINTNGALTLNCTGASIGSYECFWASFSLRFVENGTTPYLVGDSYGLYLLHLAGDWADSDLKKAVTIMAANSVGTLAATYALSGALSASTFVEDDIIYSSKVLAQADPFHGFPAMMDAEIVENGTLTTGSGNYVQYNMPGTITLTGSNGVTTVYSGVYQVGGIWSADGTLYVTHHYYEAPY